jgi:hypothetical protein
MIVAVVNNGVVTQIVTIPDGDQTGIYAQLASSCQIAVDITAAYPQPQVGWIFTGSALAPGPNSVQSMQITKLAFRERFTTPELMGILSAASGTSNTALELQIMMQNQSLATYVDLSRSDTQAGVEFLVSLGLLTQPRATAILTTQPTASEIYQG